MVLASERAVKQHEQVQNRGDNAGVQQPQAVAGNSFNDDFVDGFGELASAYAFLFIVESEDDPDSSCDVPN